MLTSSGQAYSRQPSIERMFSPSSQLVGVSVTSTSASSHSSAAQSDWLCSSIDILKSPQSSSALAIFT